MECFTIEWKGLYSIETVLDDPKSREKGVYAVYDPEYGDRLHYIGKSKEIATRLKQHLREWTRNEPDRKFKICFGIVHPLEGKLISPKQISIVEKLLISSAKPKPKGNKQFSRYVGKPVIVFNTGKTESLKRVISSHPDLLQFLKDNLSSSW